MNNAQPVPPTVLIFMGVAGCGKTTVARLFAEKTGATFYEGDDFHPPENITKMRAGAPLTDDDRGAWLQTIRKVVEAALAANVFTVLTCSALKAKYREQLQGGEARVRFIYLAASRAVIKARLKKRTGHFMPASLLDSQFAILEPPADAVMVNAEKDAMEIVDEVIQILGMRRTS